MVPKDAVLHFIKGPAADQAKVRHIFLSLPPEGLPALWAAGKLKRSRTDEGRDGTLAETVIARTEHRPKNAIAGGLYFTMWRAAYALSVAIAAGCLGEADGI